MRTMCCAVPEKVDVVDGEHHEVGVIESVVVDVDSGAALYAVVDRGHERTHPLVAVPWRRVHPETGAVWRLEAVAGEIDQVEAFDRDSRPDFSDRHWGDRIHRQFGTVAPWRSYPPFYPGEPARDFIV